MDPRGQQAFFFGTDNLLGGLELEDANEVQERLGVDYDISVEGIIQHAHNNDCDYGMRTPDIRYRDVMFEQDPFLHDDSSVQQDASEIEASLNVEASIKEEKLVDVEEEKPADQQSPQLSNKVHETVSISAQMIWLNNLFKGIEQAMAEDRKPTKKELRKHLKELNFKPSIAKNAESALFGRLCKIFNRLPKGANTQQGYDLLCKHFKSEAGKSNDSVKKVDKKVEKNKTTISIILGVPWFKEVVSEEFPGEWNRFQSKHKKRWSLEKMLEVINDPDPNREWWVERHRVNQQIACPKRA